MNDQADSQKNEQRLLTWLRVAQIILLPLAAWIGVEVWNMSVSVARIETQVGFLETSQDRMLNRIDKVAGEVTERVRPIVRSETNEVDDASRVRHESLNTSISALDQRVNNLQENQEALTSNLRVLVTTLDRAIPRDTSGWEEYRNNPRNWGRSNPD